MAKTSNDSDKFIIRLPDGMREMIKAAAVKNGRTMNAEVVSRIEMYDVLWANMAEYSGDNERLTGELTATKAALAEQQAITRALQGLLNQHSEEAHFKDENDKEVENYLEKSFGALKEQTEYLEALKHELLLQTKKRSAPLSDAEKEELWQWIKERDKSEK